MASIVLAAMSLLYVWFVLERGFVPLGLLAVVEILAIWRLVRRAGHVVNGAPDVSIWKIAVDTYRGHLRGMAMDLYLRYCIPDKKSADEQEIHLTASRQSSILWTIAVFIIAFILAVTHRPDAITNPQPWAEDGTIFIADAYNIGLRCVFHPYAGYLVVFQRIVALIATNISLAQTPLILNCVALCVQAGICTFVGMSDRLADQFSSRASQLTIAALVIAFPYAPEIHGHITNSQWFFPILGVAIIFAKPASTALREILDYIIIAVIALTGPFSIMLAPISLLKARGGRRHMIFAALICAGAVLQYVTLRTQHRAVSAFSVKSAIGFLGGRVGILPVFGPGQYLPPGISFVSVVAAILVIMIYLWGLKNGGPFLKGMMYLGAALFVTTMLTCNGIVTSNPHLLMWWMGSRYFFLSAIAMLMSLSYMAFTKCSWRILAVPLFCLAIWGIHANWRYQPLPDYHYRQQVAKLNTLAPGRFLDIPICPMGWQMRLYKPVR